MRVAVAQVPEGDKDSLSVRNPRMYAHGKGRERRTNTPPPGQVDVVPTPGTHAHQCKRRASQLLDSVSRAFALSFR